MIYVICHWVQCAVFVAANQMCLYGSDRVGSSGAGSGQFFVNYSGSGRVEHSKIYFLSAENFMRI